MNNEGLLNFSSDKLSRVANIEELDRYSREWFSGSRTNLNVMPPEFVTNCLGISLRTWKKLSHADESIQLAAFLTDDTDTGRVKHAIDYFNSECLGISLDEWKTLDKKQQNDMLYTFLTAKTDTGILGKAIHDVQFKPKNTHFREINLQGPSNPVKKEDTPEGVEEIVIVSSSSESGDDPDEETRLPDVVPQKSQNCFPAVSTSFRESVISPLRSGSDSTSDMPESSPSASRTGSVHSGRTERELERSFGHMSLSAARASMSDIVPSTCPRTDSPPEFPFKTELDMCLDAFRAVVYNQEGLMKKTVTKSLEGKGLSLADLMWLFNDLECGRKVTLNDLERSGILKLTQDERRTAHEVSEPLTIGTKILQVIFTDKEFREYFLKRFDGVLPSGV